MRPRRHLGGRGLGGRGIGQRSTSAGFSPTTALLAAPADPTLTLTTGATDNTPGFQFDGAIVELDNVRFQYSQSSDFSSGVFEITNAIDAAEDAANQLIFSTGALADGTWYFRARIERPLHFPSLWSNTETETIDATAPTLSSPTGTKTGETTASLSVSTNEGNGTVYWIVDTNTTTPSAAQVKLGKDQGGNAADDSGSQAVIATGAQTISGGADGLTGSTTYKAFYMHEDAVGNQSTVSAQSGTFTTDAAAQTTVYDHDTSGGTADIGYNGYTAVQLIPASALDAASGTQIRITSNLTLPVGTTVDAVYVGRKAAAGDAYDFNGNQVAVLYSGSGVVSGAGLANYVSDWVTLGEAYDETKDYLFVLQFGGAGGSIDTKFITSVGGTRGYYKAAAAEASTTDKSGYTSQLSGGDCAQFISKVEVR